MKPIRLLAGFAVAALSVAVGVEAQGLGDAAKREKDRRTQTAPTSQAPTKTYTGDDILGLGSGEAQYGGDAAAPAPTRSETSAPSGGPMGLLTAVGSTGSSESPVAPAVGPGDDSTPSRSTARSETYWRSRAQSARAAVDAAENRVKDLEAEEARNGPFVPGSTGPACQEGVMAPNPVGLSPVHLRDEAKGQTTCNGEMLRRQRGQVLRTQLEAARQQLASAKKALDDLEDEGRRGGALPGWLR